MVIQIDPDYKPAPLEHKEVYGVTFEQGRQELPINDELISNIVTKNKELPEDAKRDMKIALITLKYTQSNSVCFVKDGQAIGVGAGQQSRVHCTRLAGQKADNWFLRQSPKVLGLPVRDGYRAGQTETTPSTFTSGTNTWTSGGRRLGEDFHREAGSVYREKKNAHGWIS